MSPSEVMKSSDYIEELWIVNACLFSLTSNTILTDYISSAFDEGLNTRKSYNVCSLRPLESAAYLSPQGN